MSLEERLDAADVQGLPHEVLDIPHEDDCVEDDEEDDDEDEEDAFFLLLAA